MWWCCQRWLLPWVVVCDVLRFKIASTSMSAPTFFRQRSALWWYDQPPVSCSSVLVDWHPQVEEVYEWLSAWSNLCLLLQVFATYPNEDYDRRNEDVDPMAASAEYELEKRVERLDLFPVELEKGAKHNNFKYTRTHFCLKSSLNRHGLWSGYTSIYSIFF